jgi:DHA3 family multidrug efflux protein-like MFS transporter
MNSQAGEDAFGWLLGEGEARGIALVFLVAGLVMVLAGILAFFTKSYRLLSKQYLDQKESVPVGEPDPSVQSPR